MDDTIRWHNVVPPEGVDVEVHIKVTQEMFAAEGVKALDRLFKRVTPEEREAVLNAHGYVDLYGASYMVHNGTLYYFMGDNVYTVFEFYPVTGIVRDGLSVVTTQSFKGKPIGQYRVSPEKPVPLLLDQDNELNIPNLLPSTTSLLDLQQLVRVPVRRHSGVANWNVDITRADTTAHVMRIHHDDTDLEFEIVNGSVTVTSGGGISEIKIQDDRVAYSLCPVGNDRLLITCTDNTVWETSVEGEVMLATHPYVPGYTVTAVCTLDPTEEDPACFRVDAIRVVDGVLVRGFNLGYLFFS